jgi:diaminohydroxyphosphoribosylaminopyrimidine deaminase/5-amino-6-(5-phosphoribosylamino)uracil reductase
MTDSKQYEPAMRRAMELSLLGPTFGGNPQVGAVILDKDLNVIAEGFHKGAGTNHAEVDALSKLSVVPEGAVAVVTLEPCNHTGKTGPCAVALIEAGIKSVVYGASDPGDASAGGAKTLTDAGVSVTSGLLADEIEEQQKVWLTAMRKQRPFITLKWAQTLDGRSAATDKTSKWISGSESRNHVHTLRSEIDAILVGTNTVIQDNPELTARKPDGSLYDHQPLRVVMGVTELASELRVFNSDAKTVQYKTHEIKEVLDSLWALDVRHLLVEGGAKVMSAFIEADLFDEILIYQAPLLVGGSNVAVEEIGISTMADAKQLDFTEVTQLDKDIFIRAIPRKAN